MRLLGIPGCCRHALRVTHVGNRVRAAGERHRRHRARRVRRRAAGRVRRSVESRADRARARRRHRRRGPLQRRQPAARNLHTVTFTLQGFSIYRREGIVLTAGFTAAVNADMQVSTIAETITVSGETPLVDTQNVRRQTVVSSETLDLLPTSVKNPNALIGLTLGLSGIADVGGIYATQVGGNFHGKGGTRTQFDGMSVQNMTGNAGYQLNPRSSPR